MAELAATDVFTPELLAKLAAWSARWINPDADVRSPPARIAAALHEAGIGLVDLDRQRCLVDERVYESALHRGRVGALFLDHRQPAPEVWRGLTP